MSSIEIAEQESEHPVLLNKSEVVSSLTRPHRMNLKGSCMAMLESSLIGIRILSIDGCKSWVATRWVATSDGFQLVGMSTRCSSESPTVLFGKSKVFLLMEVKEHSYAHGVGVDVR